MQELKTTTFQVGQKKRIAIANPDRTRLFVSCLFDSADTLPINLCASADDNGARFVLSPDTVLDWEFNGELWADPGQLNGGSLTLYITEIIDVPEVANNEL